LASVFWASDGLCGSQLVYWPLVVRGTPPPWTFSTLVCQEMSVQLSLDLMERLQLKVVNGGPSGPIQRSEETWWLTVGSWRIPWKRTTFLPL
jgi:hypothetical protein